MVTSVSDFGVCNFYVWGNVKQSVHEQSYYRKWAAANVPKFLMLGSDVF
jgi:hypothetical protein